MAAVFVVGLAALAGLSLVHVLQGQAGLSVGDVWSALFGDADDLEASIVRFSRLPRIVVALLCGAALGISGALMQTITRNPLASPATLGVNAGAYLALVIGAVVAPGLITSYGWWLASLGGVAAAFLAFALGGGMRGGPARLALAGMAVSLALAAVTGSLQLIFENETQSLFLWGAGTLAQTDWTGVQFALPRVVLPLLLALAIAPGLDVILLGEDVARSLGGRVALTRLLGGVGAVLLAAAAVSVIGPIAFVGLLAPHIVRLSGVRAHVLLLPATALWGGVFLIGADVLARLVPSGATPLPAGAATAFLGAPLVIWLARRSAGEAMRTAQAERVQARIPYPWTLVTAGTALVAALAAGLSLGAIQVPAGEVVAALTGGGSELAQRIVLEMRLPRLVVAALAGGALAVSGVLLQGVVRNPLAAPEIVGVTSGAGVAALTALLVVPGLSQGWVPVAAFVGGVGAFGIVYAASWRGGVSPIRLALVGLAVSALFSAVISALVVAAGLRVAQALTWLAGTTYARGWDEAVRLAPWFGLLIVAALLARQLDLMALGEDLPVALGVSLQRSRAMALATAVALASAAVAAVGTLSFVGLMAPHMARVLAGPRHGKLLPLALVIGAVLVVAADTIGRTLFAPRELPSGLMTAAIGAPYFLLLMVLTTRPRGA